MSVPFAYLEAKVLFSKNILGMYIIETEHIKMQFGLQDVLDYSGTGLGRLYYICKLLILSFKIHTNSRLMH